MAEIRDRVRALFNGVLGSERHAKALESCVYNVVCETCPHAKFWDNTPFRKAYSVKARSILFNLKNPATPHLKEALLAAEGVEPFRRIVRLTHQEMHPELWAPVFQERERKANRSLCELPKDHKGLVQCGKCKSWRTDFRLVQTRAADEPSTAFWSCHDCGKRWRQSA